MTDAEPDVLAFAPAGRRAETWTMLAIIALAVVFAAVRFVTSDDDVVWRAVWALWWLLLAIPAGQFLGEPHRIEISPHGITWHGLGWRRTVPWAGFTAVGTHRYELGISGTWLAGRLDGGARPSAWRYPRRLLTTSLRGSDEVAGLVRLTQDSWWPGTPGRRRPRRTRPAWDVADEEIVQAVRTHAADRWVGEIPSGPPDGAPRNR